MHLRNVQGRLWNHKRVYRIYCELELNLRIKSRKRLKRDKPDALAVPPDATIDPPERLRNAWAAEHDLACGLHGGPAG